MSVTFALLAFNQEDYIRQAISSAFRQTYTPMEIILSDDCSTDRTFEIMTEMAAEYSGPNRVRVVRNSRNMGVFAHALSRGREATGEVVVCAAGDDVSLPSRTQEIVDAFTPDVACVFSHVSIVDENGDVIAPKADRPLHFPAVRTDFLTINVDHDTIIQGCSAAYRKWVFDLPIDARGNNYPEDYFFNNLLNLIGAKIVRLDSVLVEYRSHSRALSNFATTTFLGEEEKTLVDARRRLNMLADFEDIAAILGKQDRLASALIAEQRLCGQCRADWPDLGFTQRFRRMLSFVSAGMSASDIRCFIWCLIRLWGNHPRYQPKFFLSRFQKKYSKPIS